MIGVIVMIGAFVGPLHPDAADTAGRDAGTLAGISITFISMRPGRADVGSRLDRPAGARDHPDRVLHRRETAVRLPVGLAALLVGTAIGWIGGYMSAPDVGKAISDIAIGIPDLRVDLLWSGLSNLAPLLGTAIPLGSTTSPRAMSNVERGRRRRQLQPAQRAAGRRRRRRHRFGVRIAVPAGGLHRTPGWKDAGGRASYSLASGAVIGLFCFLGLSASSRALLPVPAIVPILLYIGLLIGAQAFQAVPRLHAIAVVAALLPNLAQWASGLIDNALSAAATSADKVGVDANSAGVGTRGCGPWVRGRGPGGPDPGHRGDFHPGQEVPAPAAVADAGGSALSFIGLIHAPEVAWAANPQSGTWPSVLRPGVSGVLVPAGGPQTGGAR